jgi:hypothetical protein
MQIHDILTFLISPRPYILKSKHFSNKIGRYLTITLKTNPRIS